MVDFLRKLDDPELNEREKVNSKDFFELVYLRHRYFRRSTNPEPSRLKEFEEMICNISDKIYHRNIAIFKLVGFESEDLKNIGRINTISFISMCGLKENSKLMEKFRIDHKKIYGEESEPHDRDVFLKECYNLSKYLNQRLQEVAKFCENKSANIIGDKAKKMYFIGDSQKKPNDNVLLSSPESCGFKKLKIKDFKQILKNLKRVDKTSFLTPEGQIIRIVYKKPNYLAAEEFYKNNSENESNLSAEELMIRKENLLIAQKLSSKKKV